MQDSCAESGIVLSEDWAQLSADGGSNAIGSIQKYEVVSRSEGQQTSVEFNICYSCQNEHSGGYASGTMKFADKPNEELGAILRKSHEIQVRISWAPKRMKLYSDIQRRQGRKPLLAPDPAGETRWNGCIDETTRANQIMGTYVKKMTSCWHLMGMTLAWWRNPSMSLMISVALPTI